MQQPSTVFIQQSGPTVGPQSTRIECPSCRAPVQTRVERAASTKTHLMALLICILGGCCCCCIPYCVDSCQDANHYCPNCSAYIGAYKS